MTVVTLLPFVSIVFASLNPPGSLVSGMAVPASSAWSSFREAWTTASFGRLLWSSVEDLPGRRAHLGGLRDLAGYALGTLKVPGAAGSSARSSSGSPCPSSSSSSRSTSTCARSG